MLVLTRRSQESLEIGDGIEVRILAVHGNRVLVGIDAPRGIPIARGELIAREANESVTVDSAAAHAIDPAVASAHPH